MNCGLIAESGLPALLGLAKTMPESAVKKDFNSADQLGGF
jgi:hypothetical protein